MHLFWDKRSNVYEASLSGSVIDTVIKTGNLITVPVECHGDDTSLTFQDTHLFSLLILLVHVNKFNVYEGSPNADSTRRVLSLKDSNTRNYTSQYKMCNSSFYT